MSENNQHKKCTEEGCTFLIPENSNTGIVFCNQCEKIVLKSMDLPVTPDFVEPVVPTIVDTQSSEQ